MKEGISMQGTRYEIFHIKDFGKSIRIITISAFNGAMETAHYNCNYSEYDLYIF